ncbi:unnamed protein product, partial [Ectocarpus sp. 8 AP-2014]
SENIGKHVRVEQVVFFRDHWLKPLGHWDPGKYEEAEPLYKRSVAIDEALYGPDHPDVA